VTEINEQGPEIHSDDLGLLHEKLDYLGKAADAVVFAGSVPPGLHDDCYAELIQHVRKLGLISLFYSYADPLRLGIKARADYVFPKLVEAEKVIGYEFTSFEDRINAAKTMREMGAGSVVITYRYGCVAVMADGEGSRTFIGKIPPVDVVSPLGWGDTFAGGFAVRLLEGDSPADCLRFGLGCGAANLIDYGAGVFSAADAERLAELVELEEVSAES
jgi:1-phosphofructokinase